MEKFTFLGKKVAMSAFLCCFSLVGFAQEDTQTFNFDATETQVLIRGTFLEGLTLAIRN